jgi:glycosyltransferase involved in cell wall biosynthesis
MISVFIPTKNEERDLPGCLQSVGWSDDVFVYDSYSTDSTAEVARMAGAHFVQRPAQETSRYFGGDEAAHKNWALQHLPFKYPWVLHLDADERVTAELANSIRGSVRAPGASVAFRVQRRDFLLGCWLKHVQATPYYIRLFRPEKLRYERLINPVSIADGPVGDLSGYLEHFPFSKGIGHWLDRHNCYSTLEAEQILLNRAAQAPFSIARAFLAKDFHERRFHQKELFYRAPARPLIKFALLYFAKRGFLDGRAGFMYAVLQSFYEYMIVLKTRELAAAEPAPGKAEAPETVARRLSGER